jgi:hypothetical protein
MSVEGDRRDAAHVRQLSLQNAICIICFCILKVIFKKINFFYVFLYIKLIIFNV